MSSDEFSGADYDLLVSLLKDQAAIRMGDTSKAQAVKDFAQQRSLQLPAVIEHLMSKQSGVLSFPVLQSLMQPAAPAPAPGPAPTPAPAAVPAVSPSPMSEVHLAAARALWERFMARVAEYQVLLEAG